ncbi:MAG: carboxypeptidase-like regulatory domain-containing protein [Gemmatimonadaceae bacterium]|nr:carboxypeptidase-like regulatory domain-containing protein [Gemmatimonadaceae bacterium]
MTSATTLRRRLVAATALLLAWGRIGAAQEAPAAPATVAGVVVDSTGAPIIGVRIAAHAGAVGADEDSLRGAPASEAVSAGDGTFRLVGVPIGDATLVFAHPDFRTLRAEVQVANGVTISVRITLLAREPIAAPPITLPGVRGIVTDTSGAPLAGAEVAILGADVAVRTDSAGRFILTDDRPFRAMLRVRRIGYSAAFRDVATGDHDLGTVVLQPAGQRLATVEVRARWGTRALEDFQRRRLLHGGVHITSDEIERRGVSRVSELFFGRAGISVDRDRANNGVLLGRRQCRLRVLLNGFPVPGSDVTIDEIINPTEIVAIEAYPAAINTPSEFVDPRSSCGSVVVSR